jgi:hypothetical protein
MVPCWKSNFNSISPSMERRVVPELLDTLPPDAHGAIRSRADLRRLNRWMGHASIAARTLRAAFPRQAPRRIVELGAGDGSLLLQVAESLPSTWRGTRALLVDRHDIVSNETREGFRSLGWSLQTSCSEALEWFRKFDSEDCDALLANLFLHHFSSVQLAELLRETARRVQVFIGIEPLRSKWALMSTRLLALCGFNSVTCHDAPVSVCAGFIGKELSQLWPADGVWRIEERQVGWSTHLFVAQRRPEGQR